MEDVKRKKKKSRSLDSWPMRCLKPNFLFFFAAASAGIFGSLSYRLKSLGTVFFSSNSNSNNSSNNSNNTGNSNNSDNSNDSNKNNKSVYCPKKNKQYI